VVGGGPREIYPRIRPILNEAKFRGLPEALLDLARIERFNLFIVLTFDSFLAKAIDQVRFDGEERTQELSYWPNRPDDLPCLVEELRQPVVYHLLGKLSAQANEYVVTDEDMLEFLQHMQQVERPGNLIDSLRENHLLFIGCSFSDWLARFFIRIVRRRRLSLGHPAIEALVNDVEHPENLVAFLTHFSPGTKIVSCPPGQFVALLLGRYREHASSRKTEKRVLEPRFRGMTEAEAGGVFLSYANEDYAAARRLRNSLDQNGIDVWFDETELKGGDDWDLVIRHRLRNCSYFLPVISASAMRDPERYFLREWNLAVERSKGFREGEPFIIPVVIDDTQPGAQGVPERFRNSQWTHLPGGEGNQSFTSRMRELVRNDQRKRKRS